MSAPIPVLLVVLSVVASTWTRINAVILGRPVSVPVIGVIALAVVLALIVALLWLLRSLLTFRSSPHLRTVPGA